MMRVLVNGREDDAIDPLDRGLLYGDGLFETIAVRDGNLRWLDWHLERLAEGANRLGFPQPEWQALRAELSAVAAGATSAVVKLILTRGLGTRGYRPPRAAQPTRIVALFPWPAARPAAARVGWCRTRLGRNPALAGLKHLNRLEQVLARAEWDDGEQEEGLMQDESGQVIAATQANLFVRFEGGAWVTPSLAHCGVAGVMRRAFRTWSAGQGAPVVERELTRSDVERASSLLLTNALIGAWPVQELAGRLLAIDAAAAAFNDWVERP